MANLDKTKETWLAGIDVAAAKTYTAQFNTKDKYLTKDIVVEVNVPDAELAKLNDESANGAISAAASIADNAFTSETETAYALTLQADAHVNAVKVGTTTAGYTDTSDVVTIAAADAEQATKTVYIKEGHLEGSGEASATGSIELTKVAAQPEEGFYVKASAAGGARVDVAGWLPVGATADASGDAYYTVQKAVLSNKETNADDFETIVAPVLTEDGYLFINEGYIADTKISLATLVPDNANITSENADKVYNTVKAYDNDGKLIVGTMGNAVLGNITANDAAATVTTVSVVANEDNTGFKVSGENAISGSTSVQITTRGLAETDLKQEGTISGTANVDATLAKIGLAASVADNDIEVTPVIAKNTETTASSGAITTSKPTGFFIAVDTAAIEASTTVTPNVASEGYGTADVYSATSATVKAGAAASGTYYVPLTAAEHSVTVNETASISAPVTSVTTSLSGGDVTPVAIAENAKDANTEYIKISASSQTTDGQVIVSGSCASTEGYITASNKDFSKSVDVAVANADAADKYIAVYGGLWTLN